MLICLLALETSLAVPTPLPVDESYTDIFFILLKLSPVTVSLTDPATAMTGEMELIAGTPIPPQAAVQIKGIRSMMKLETNDSPTFFTAVLQPFVQF